MNRNDRFVRGARKAEDSIEAGAIVPHKRITLSYDFAETTSYTGDNALERIPRQQGLSNMPLSQKRISAEDPIFLLPHCQVFYGGLRELGNFFVVKFTRLPNRVTRTLENVEFLPFLCPLEEIPNSNI